MNPTVTVRTADGRSTITIFTNQIATILHAANGCIINVNGGGQLIEIKCGETADQVLKRINSKF